MVRFGQGWSAVQLMLGLSPGPNSSCQPGPGPAQHYLPLSTSQPADGDGDGDGDDYPPPSAPPPGSFLHPAPIQHSLQRLSASLLSLTAAIVSALIFLALWYARSRPVPPRPTLAFHPPGVHNLSSSLDWDGSCNPFAEHGYLDFHPNDTLRNNWLPFNAQCPPSRLLRSLVDDLQKFSRGGVDPETTGRALPWLVNRTVVLFGDSIERFHLRDFCDLLSSQVSPPFHNISENGFSASKSTNDTPSKSFFVTHDSPIAPPTYFFDPMNKDKVPPGWPDEEKKTYVDHHYEWATRDNIRTSPWICQVPSYRFTIVSVFTFGLEPEQAGFLFAHQDWYISPPKLLDRLDHVLLPLLTSLSHSQSRPSILQPDLIEFSSALWDLRQYSEQDARVLGVKLDDSTEAVYSPLTQDRLDQWRKGTIEALKKLDESFSENEDATILWRRLHHPLRHSLAPYSRVEQLDQLGRQVVEDLVFGGEHENRRNGTRLAKRLKVDSWGRKMLGFENKMRDPVHPKAVPGSVLWSEMMLWELRRSVLGREARNMKDSKAMEQKRERKKEHRNRRTRKNSKT